MSAYPEIVGDHFDPRHIPQQIDGFTWIEAHTGFAWVCCETSSERIKGRVWFRDNTIAGRSSSMAEAQWTVQAEYEGARLGEFTKLEAAARTLLQAINAEKRGMYSHKVNGIQCLEF